MIESKRFLLVIGIVVIFTLAIVGEIFVYDGDMSSLPSSNTDENSDNSDFSGYIVISSRKYDGWKGKIINGNDSYWAGMNQNNYSKILEDNENPYFSQQARIYEVYSNRITVQIHQNQYAVNITSERPDRTYINSIFLEELYGSWTGYYEVSFNFERGKI